MKKIQVQVNPNLEFINSILLTSRYNEITTPYIGYGLMTSEVNEYTDNIKRFFEKHLQDPVYPYIESLIPHGFIFNRPVELMLCLGNSRDFTMQHSPCDLCIEYCGGLPNIHELLRLLRDFESRIGYFAFFEEAKRYYDPFIEQAREIAERFPYVSMLEEEYGKEQNSYNYVISFLMRGSFGISFEDQSGKQDIFSVFTKGHISTSGVLFHEYSHPFINLLTDKYADMVKEYDAAYERLKPYKLPGFQSGYGEWIECVNEHLVRAMTIHLLRKCGQSNDADELLRYELFCGYKYIPFILEAYEYYDNHRDLYPDFEAFYPTLLKVFSREID